MLSERQIVNTGAMKLVLPTGLRNADAVTSNVAGVAVEFGFGLAEGELSESLFIRNDGTSAIEVSLDGGDTYGALAAGASMADISVARASIHVKSAAVSQPFVLWVGGAF